MSKDSDRFNLDRFGCDLPSRAAFYRRAPQYGAARDLLQTYCEIITLGTAM